MGCPQITSFTTDPITLVYIIFIVINLSLVIYALMGKESFVTLGDVSGTKTSGSFSS